KASAFIPCAASIGGVKDLIWYSWNERLVAERLTRKANNVLLILKQTNDHWEETFWRLLTNNFGIKVNSSAFQSIAENISITILARHKNNLLQLEALLFGTGDLLNDDFTDEYPKQLKNEYSFLKSKYGLRPSHYPLHFLRMRPHNFPIIRLAQLAKFIHEANHLFSKLMETDDLKEIQLLLNVDASDYWNAHYRFDNPSRFKKKKVGTEMISNIIINTIVPVLFAYGLYKNEEQYKIKAIQWLENTRAEKNTIIDGFTKNNIINKSAYDSQAFIELKNEYCNHKRCLECSVGIHLLKRNRFTSSSQ
ncbi:MAG TPA: DUF2851 family protein, partial [Chitinophagaceae bacterium]|nr:DUF2851 family protein [Chitinophagaceae bacterium]